MAVLGHTRWELPQADAAERRVKPGPVQRAPMALRHLPFLAFAACAATTAWAAVHQAGTMLWVGWAGLVTASGVLITHGVRLPETQTAAAPLAPAIPSGLPSTGPSPATATSREKA